MEAKSMSRSRKLLLLSALYIAQGLPHGFFTQALPVLLRKAEVSLPMIGLSQLLTLPWALKFLWAPAVDRFQYGSLGLRRSWLLPVQFTSIATYFALAASPPSEGLALVLFAFVCTNFLAATQDIATDGLAVDLLSPSERGWANGIQVAGYRMGMILAGWVLLAAFDVLKWSGMMISLAVLTALCTWPVLRYQEPPRKSDEIPQSRSLKEILHFFTKPGAPLWIIILLLYKAGHASATNMLRPWLVDQKYDSTSIASILGTSGFVAGFFGAIIGGAIASKYDRKKLLVALGVLQFFAVASYTLPVLTEHAMWKVAVTAAFDHFTSGLATATLFTMMMDACSKERAASDYTVQSCLVVIAAGAAGAMSGLSAEVFGYGVHFMISAALTAFGVSITALLLRSPRLRTLLTP